MLLTSIEVQPSCPPQVPCSAPVQPPGRLPEVSLSTLVQPPGYALEVPGSVLQLPGHFPVVQLNTTEEG